MILSKWQRNPRSNKKITISTTSEVRSGSILNKSVIKRLLGDINNSRQAEPDEQKGTDSIKALKYESHRFNQNCPNYQYRNRP